MKGEYEIGTFCGVSLYANVSGSEADVLRKAFASWAKFHGAAMEYGIDMLNTISSIDKEEFPATKKARMDRRMALRQAFANAVIDLENHRRLADALCPEQR